MPSMLFEPIHPNLDEARDQLASIHGIDARTVTPDSAITCSSVRFCSVLLTCQITKHSPISGPHNNPEKRAMNCTNLFDGASGKEAGERIRKPVVDIFLAAFATSFSFFLASRS